MFCVAQSIDEGRQLIVHEGALAYVILNKFPYNSGHLMVVPQRHAATLASLTRDELNEMALLTQLSERVLTEAFTPQGINVGLNLGRPAGAGIVDHLHIHLVPRWNGDTNFMTVVGRGARVAGRIAADRRSAAAAVQCSCRALGSFLFISLTRSQASSGIDRVVPQARQLQIFILAK